MKKAMMMCVKAMTIASLSVAAFSASAEIGTHALKMAYVTAPDTGKYNGTDRFVELVKQKSAGKIDIKVFPGGSMGGDVQMISALQGGILDVAVMGTQALVGTVKEFGLYDLPFLFDSDKEAYAVMDGPVGKQMFDLLAQKGVIGMPISAYGFRHLHNSKRPINRMEDVQGLKIRVLQTPLYVDIATNLGANPVPMSFTEVYSAMDSKAIDGMTNIPIIASSMKAYEVQKYFSLTKHMYNPLVVLISKKAWDKFNSDEQALITQAVAEAREHQRKLLPEFTAKALADLKSNGMVVNEVPAQEVARMREKTKPVLAKYVPQIGEGLVKQANDQLVAMRK